MYFTLTQAVVGTTMVIWDNTGATIATINNGNPAQDFSEDLYASCQARIVDLVRNGDLIQTQTEETGTEATGTIAEEVVTATGQVCSALVHTPSSKKGMWVWVDKVPVLQGAGADNWDVVLLTKIITFGANIDLVGKPITVKYFY